MNEFFGYDFVKSEPGEEWRQVVGYEGFYAVSNLGRVQSRRRPGAPGGLIRPTLSRSTGYRSARLTKGNRQFRTFRVHELVTTAFIGPRPPGAVTRHLNGNKLDNRLANLTYGTMVENAQDTLAHGQNINAAKTHCKHGHEFTPENTYIYDEGAKRACRKCTRRTALAGYHRRKALKRATA